jgi:tripartite-type tricarboxylate transporter receptor subunit TctC
MLKKTATRTGLVLLAVMMSFMWASPSLAAEDYPKGPVQIVIPFGPGGLTDIFWRSTSEFIANNMKGTIVLVNKPGGGGVVGTSFGVNAKPDGYTLFSANSDPLTISTVFTPDVPYDPDKDVTYIAKMAAFAFTIAVQGDSPFKSIEDLVAYAKANPKKLKASVMGVGSTPHTIVQVLNRDANIEITPVPFDSGGESVTSLLGGHTELTVTSLSSLKPHVLSGKARILAFCSPKRLSEFPDVPTISEKGYKRSSIATGVGLAGPKGLPPTMVSKWQEVIDKTFKDPKVIEVIEKLGGGVIDYKTGEAYKKELMGDLAVFRELLPTLPGKK